MYIFYEATKERTEAFILIIKLKEFTYVDFYMQELQW